MAVAKQVASPKQRSYTVFQKAEIFPRRPTGNVGRGGDGRWCPEACLPGPSYTENKRVRWQRATRYRSPAITKILCDESWAFVRRGSVGFGTVPKTGSE